MDMAYWKIKFVKYLAHIYVFKLGRLRTWFYAKIMHRIGQNVFLFKPFYCTSPEGIAIGDEVCISSNCRIGGEGGLTIGNFVMVGPNTVILTSNHGFERTDIPMMRQSITAAPVVIQDDVWIGANVVVLPGVTIGQGAIIGAFSLVAKDVEPYAVMAGAPARVLKHRVEDQAEIARLMDPGESPLYRYYQNDFLITGNPKVFRYKDQEGKDDGA